MLRPPPADATLDSSLIWTEPLLEEIIPQASDEVVPEAKVAVSVPVERDLPTPRVAEGSWSVTGSLNTGRQDPAAVKLNDGRVLVVGGGSDPEIYNPTTGTWNYVSPSNELWNGPKATLLTDSRVLVYGTTFSGASDRHVEIYSPAIDTWNYTATPDNPRDGGVTMTLLINGTVLLLGGYYINFDGSSSPYQYATESYNPNTVTWDYTGDIFTSRCYHTATLLTNGTVLIVGGVGGEGLTGIRNEVDIYDPTTYSSWTVNYMAEPRISHMATRLANGKVLIAGGDNNLGEHLNTAEVYDPVSGTLTRTGSMLSNRCCATSTLLPSGKVLVAGGRTDGANTTDSAEIYNPVTGTWSDAGYMSTERMLHSATLLANGKVLIVGGLNQDSTAELYTPAVAKPDFMITAMTIAPVAPTANGTFTATITVKNQGTGAGDGKFLDVWSHQPAAKACGAVGNKRVAVGAIAAGASKALTVTGLPAGIAGSKMLRAFVDSGCGTVESNDNNNQFTALYSVNQATGINLTVTLITLNPATPVANRTFNAVVQVKNLGTVAGDGKFLDVWSNQPAGQVCGAVGNKRLAVGVLAAGAAKNLTFTGLAAGVAGAKTFRAFVDSGCGTGENNEGNNQLTKVYSVQ